MLHSARNRIELLRNNALSGGLKQSAPTHKRKVGCFYDKEEIQTKKRKFISLLSCALAHFPLEVSFRIHPL